MEIFTCTQHGCEIEADEAPEVCPVCNNPQGNAEDLEDADDWSGYTKAELLAQCADWDLEDYSAHNSKAELIVLLEAAEAADDDDDDDA